LFIAVFEGTDCCRVDKPDVPEWSMASSPPSVNGNQHTTTSVALGGLSEGTDPLDQIDFW